jgi:hypothetical protein
MMDIIISGGMLIPVNIPHIIAARQAYNSEQGLGNHERALRIALSWQHSSSSCIDSGAFREMRRRIFP